MSDIANITITGRLTRDAESVTTGSGMRILKFSVANTTGFGTNERTAFYECALFGKRAEGGLARYLTKGTSVGVSGTMSMNEYTTKMGEKRINPNINVSEVALLGSAKNGSPVEGAGLSEPTDIPF